MFLQTVLSGLAVGSLYALAAIGLVLIYKTSNVVNFAQGELAMFSTFIAYAVLSRWGAPYWLGALAAVVFALGLGWAVYWLLLARLSRAPLLSQIIMTLGIFLVLQGVAGAVWGNIPYPFPTPVQLTVYRVGSAFLTSTQIVTFAVALLLMLLVYALFRFTRVGLAMQAISQNMTAARLMGVSVNRVYGFGWALSTALGAVAGMLIAPTLFLSPTFMEGVMIRAFAAAVVGGFSSLPGAVVGGLLFGVLESLFGFYVSPSFKASFVSLVIIAVLYVRPHGLFGAREVKKV